LVIVSFEFVTMAAAINIIDSVGSSLFQYSTGAFISETPWTTSVLVPMPSILTPHFGGKSKLPGLIIWWSESQSRLPRNERRGNQKIFGGGVGSLIQHNVGRFQFFGFDFVKIFFGGDSRAERFQSVSVRGDGALTHLAATGVRNFEIFSK